MIRFLPVFIEIGILIYCLIDCVQTDSTRVRNLPKAVWILLIILIPLIGGIAWLIAGRPQSESGQSARRPTTRAGGFPGYGRPEAPRGPDDDPEFLRQLRDVDAEHKRTLKQWEDDLRERERRLRDEGDKPAP